MKTQKKQPVLDKLLYEKITIEKLTNIIVDVFKQAKKERNLKFYRSCQTLGSIEGFNHCGSDICEPCNAVNKSLLHEITKEIDDYELEK